MAIGRRSPSVGESRASFSERYETRSEQMAFETDDARHSAWPSIGDVASGRVRPEAEDVTEHVEFEEPVAVDPREGADLQAGDLGASSDEGLILDETLAFDKVRGSVASAMPIPQEGSRRAAPGVTPRKARAVFLAFAWIALGIGAFLAFVD